MAKACHCFRTNILEQWYRQRAIFSNNPVNNAYYSDLYFLLVHSNYFLTVLCYFLYNLYIFLLKLTHPPVFTFKPSNFFELPICLLKPDQKKDRELPPSEKRGLVGARQRLPSMFSDNRPHTTPHLQNPTAATGRGKKWF